MPKSTKTKKTTHHKKRHGHHQRRSKKFHSVYMPYLPLVAAVVISVIISSIAPRGGTLAYATDMSINGLLHATNSQRANNGKSSLTLNQKLTNAAQAKANDMVQRDYWSHNTPDGKEPWVFVNNAGYKYLKAGENLAYGFLSSSDTVTGWMNSPSHRSNMLDASFVEVGFGFANSTNFNDSGQETVVVAMYGRPQTLAATNQSETAPSEPTPAAKPTPSPTPTTQQTDDTQTKKETPKEEIEETPQEAAPTELETPYTTATSGTPVSRPVSRVQALTSGNMPWAMMVVGVILGGAVTAMLLKHSLGLRRLIRNSEEFVLHHPLLDSTLLALIILGVVLSQTVGFIQ